MPNGATLVVPQVAWDEYEQLLEELAERSRFRVSYDSGRLEIVTQLPEHGKYERLITSDLLQNRPKRAAEDSPATQRRPIERPSRLSVQSTDRKIEVCTERRELPTIYSAV